MDILEAAGLSPATLRNYQSYVRNIEHMTKKTVVEALADPHTTNQILSIECPNQTTRKSYFMVIKSLYKHSPGIAEMYAAQQEIWQRYERDNNTTIHGGSGAVAIGEERVQHTVRHFEIVRKERDLAADPETNGSIPHLILAFFIYLGTTLFNISKISFLPEPPAPETSYPNGYAYPIKKKYYIIVPSENLNIECPEVFSVILIASLARTPRSHFLNSAPYEQDSSFYVSVTRMLTNLFEKHMTGTELITIRDTVVRPKLDNVKAIDLTADMHAGIRQLDAPVAKALKDWQIVSDHGEEYMNIPILVKTDDARWSDQHILMYPMHRYVVGHPNMTNILPSGAADYSFPAVDHINRDPRDTRASNLRLCMTQQNSWNRCNQGAARGYHVISRTGSFPSTTAICPTLNKDPLKKSAAWIEDAIVWTCFWATALDELWSDTNPTLNLFDAEATALPPNLKWISEKGCGYMLTPQVFRERISFCDAFMDELITILSASYTAHCEERQETQVNIDVTKPITIPAPFDTETQTPILHRLQEAVRTSHPNIKWIKRANTRCNKTFTDIIAVMVVDSLRYAMYGFYGHYNLICPENVGPTCASERFHKKQPQTLLNKYYATLPQEDVDAYIRDRLLLPSETGKRIRFAKATLDNGKHVLVLKFSKSHIKEVGEAEYTKLDLDGWIPPRALFAKANTLYRITN
jgi:hypothetical protein